MTQQLLAEGVELEGHGGNVQLVHTSAFSGLGLEDLKEALLLQVGVAILPPCPSVSVERRKFHSGTVEVDAALECELA